MTTKSKILIAASSTILCIIFYILGYYEGKDSVEPIIKTEFIQSSPVSGLIKDPEPMIVDIPEIPWLITFKDTIRTSDTTYIIQPVDSLEILKDYLTKRTYNLNIFNIDTVGTCDITAITYRNRLELLGYNFVPINKVITNTYNKPKYQLFLGGGFGTNNMASGQLGLFFNNNWGLSYQYLYDINNKKSFNGINVLYKFNLK